MPCDLGYKSFNRVTIPAPSPLTFKKKVAAPKPDAELMERIGQDDPEFVEWMNDLDASPLSAKALEKALTAYGNTFPVDFTIENGDLAAKAKYRTAADKEIVEKIVDRVGRLWQAEVLAIVAQLLDFETQITVTKDGDGEIVMLEGEKHGSEQVHEYLRVTLDPKKGSAVLFEHFSSKKSLASVKDKFLALAQKMGVRIDVTDVKESGSPIPSGSVHKHFLKGDKE